MVARNEYPQEPDSIDEGETAEQPRPLTGYPRDLGERDAELDSRPTAARSTPHDLRVLEDRLADGTGLDGLLSHRAPAGGRQAAVLALVDPSPATTRMLFVEKAGHLRKHAGQLAFPGGSRQDGDDGPVGTAQREAGEEAAVRPDSFRVLGTLPPAHVPASGFDVTTVVAWWHTPHPVQVNDPGEIAALHWVDVPDLVDPANRARVQYPDGRGGPAFIVGDLFIWGLTAHLLEALVDIAGWSRPWDRERLVEVPQRFGRGLPGYRP